MKYLYALLLLFAISMNRIQAQTVYKTVLENATRVMNSPTSGYTQVQIAQFKCTALVYLRSKAAEVCQGEDYVRLLDTQAYYLSEFITLFFNEILKSKRLDKEEQREKILLFMDASVSNPLFDDANEELTMAYIFKGGELTPFCLNTNWQKANAAALSRL